MRISPAAARFLAISSQGLDGRWKLPKGKEGAARAVERLGYVQIDTIAVVQRAHHHTLWARCPDYAPEALDELQARDRRVFEYWCPAAAYLPMRDYRYSLRAMRGFAGSRRTRSFLDQHAVLVADVLGRIRREGPLASADFSAPPGRKRGPWWDWKPAKQALEALFSMGELMVTQRRNFQRVYDLAERVLPAGTDTSEPSAAEQARFEVRWAIARLGVARARELRRGWQAGQGAAAALAELVDAGEVTPVQVRGLDGQVCYALTESLERVPKRRGGRKRLHILSPFDGLVIRRDRLRELFGFDCKLECYLPAEKRRWGYFCLPILWGDEFIGRLDPKADRKQQTLLVRRLMFEPEFKDHDAVWPDLAAKLRAFAAFNGCRRIVIGQTQPRGLKGSLEAEHGA